MFNYPNLSISITISDLPLLLCTVCPNKKETRFISEIF